MTALKQDFEAKHGDTLTVQIPILHRDGTPVALVDPKGTWKVYELDFCVDGETPALEMDDGDGIIVQQVIVNGQQTSTWAMSIPIGKLTLAELDAGGHYHEAIVRDGDSIVRTIATGVMTILPSLGETS